MHFFIIMVIIIAVTSGLLLLQLFGKGWFSESHVVYLMSVCYRLSIKTTEIEVSWLV